MSAGRFLEGNFQPCKSMKEKRQRQKTGPAGPVKIKNLSLMSGFFTLWRKYMPTSGSTPDGWIHYPDGQMVLPCGFEPQPSEPESEILSIRLREQGLRKYEKSGEKGSRVGNNLDFWLHFGKFATS